MATLDKEKMLRKYRYFTNTTKTAKDKGYLAKELPCVICGKPITQNDVDTDNCEANVTKGNWTFFHRACMHLNTLK